MGVDVVAPEFERDDELLAVLRHPAGERHAETDLDRIGCSRRSEEHDERERGGGKGRSKIPPGFPQGASPFLFVPSRLWGGTEVRIYFIISSLGIMPHRLDADGSLAQTFGRCGASRCHGRGSK